MCVLVMFILHVSYIIHGLSILFGSGNSSGIHVAHNSAYDMFSLFQYLLYATNAVATRWELHRTPWEVVGVSFGQAQNKRRHSAF